MVAIEVIFCSEQSHINSLWTYLDYVSCYGNKSGTSMDLQLQTLTVDAFQLLSRLAQRSYLVVIDGLDECHDKATQQLILRLLCKTITVHKLPLRFLIGSRPESHICASFDQKSFYTTTHRVVLDEKFNPERDSGFSARWLCEDRCQACFMWHNHGLEKISLIQRSSGQFIYAATVLKFVGADFCSPTKQLVQMFTCII